MNSSISSKGQVTVPKQVRDKLGLRPGTVVEFEFTESGVVMRKGHKGERPVDRLRGVLRDAKRTDDCVDDMRGPRPKPTEIRR
jgi:antitoxin PrlF